MDSAIMSFVQQNLHNPLTNAVFPIITYLGENGFIWFVLILALIVSKKHRHCGVMLLFSISLAFLLGELVIKPVVARPRPFMDDPSVPLLIPPPGGFSFPSNHASSSFAVATMLTFYHKRAGTAALLLAALIAFSRIFLFVHYPTDVLAGALLGILCASGIYFCAGCIEKKKGKKYFQ